MTKYPNAANSTMVRAGRRRLHCFQGCRRRERRLRTMVSFSTYLVQAVAAQSMPLKLAM
jgi:hypothetical protein